MAPAQPTLNADIQRVRVHYQSKHNQNRMISKEQVDATLVKVVETIREKRFSLKDAFRKLDVDNSGNLTAKEFRRGLASLGLNLSEDTTEALITASDGDHDGVIQYDEWVEKVPPLRSQHGLQPTLQLSLHLIL
jgi:Ca2+-binding EF-hand superfamily protein